MILPIILENIFTIIGGMALISMLSLLCLFAISPKFESWVGASLKRTLSICLPVFFLAIICIPMSSISRGNRVEQYKKIEKEQLQEQCIEYHNNHPDNWVICPVCEEKFD